MGAAARDKELLGLNQELCDCFSAIVGLETQIKACQQRHGRCHVPQAALCNHKDIAEAAPRHGPAMLDVMLTMLADEHTRCRLLEQRMSSTLSRTALDVPSTCPALTTCSVTEQHRRGSTSAPALIEGPESPNVGVASSFRQSSASTIEPARARVGSGMESSRVDNVARNGVALQQGSGRALLHAMGKGQDKSQSTEKGESEKASAAAAVLTAWMLASSTPARKDDPAVGAAAATTGLASPQPHSSVWDSEAEIARKPSGGEELEADELPLMKDRSDGLTMEWQKRQHLAEGKDVTHSKIRTSPQKEDAEEMLHELGKATLDAAAKSDREVVERRIFHGGLHTHKHTHIHVLERLSLKHQQDKTCSRSQSQGTHESVRGTKPRPGCKSRGIERERERERGRKRRQELKGIAVTESNLQTASSSLTPAAESENQDCASEERSGKEIETASNCENPTIRNNERDDEELQSRSTFIAAAEEDVCTQNDMHDLGGSECLTVGVADDMQAWLKSLGLNHCVDLLARSGFTSVMDVALTSHAHLQSLGVNLLETRCKLLVNANKHLMQGDNVWKDQAGVIDMGSQSPDEREATREEQDSAEGQGKESLIDSHNSEIEEQPFKREKEEAEAILTALDEMNVAESDLEAVLHAMEALEKGNGIAETSTGGTRSSPITSLPTLCQESPSKLEVEQHSVWPALQSQIHLPESCLDSFSAFESTMSTAGWEAEHRTSGDQDNHICQALEDMATKHGLEREEFVELLPVLQAMVLDRSEREAVLVAMSAFKEQIEARTSSQLPPGIHEQRREAVEAEAGASSGTQISAQVCEGTLQTWGPEIKEDGSSQECQPSSPPGSPWPRKCPMMAQELRRDGEKEASMSTPPPRMPPMCPSDMGKLHHTLPQRVGASPTRPNLSWKPLPLSPRDVKNLRRMEGGVIKGEGADSGDFSPPAWSSPSVWTVRTVEVSGASATGRGTGDNKHKKRSILSRNPSKMTRKLLSKLANSFLS